jgi:hypothetical protein
VSAPVAADPPARGPRSVRRTSTVEVVLAALAAGAGCDGAARTPRTDRRPPHRVEVLGEQVTRPVPARAASTTTVALAPSTTTTITRVPAVTTTCADALAYLASHQAPGFTDVCADGSAFGHLGVTCVNQPGMCEGQRFVHIACPAPFVYMNEAHNSWTLLGRRTGIDPFGQGSDAERAACDPHR